MYISIIRRNYLYVIPNTKPFYSIHWHRYKSLVVELFLVFLIIQLSIHKLREKDGTVYGIPKLITFWSRDRSVASRYKAIYTAILYLQRRDVSWAFAVGCDCIGDYFSVFVYFLFYIFHID